MSRNTIMHRAVRGVRRNYQSYTKLAAARYPDASRRFQPLVDSFAKPKIWATTAALALVTIVSVSIATQTQHTPASYAAVAVGAEAESGTIASPAVSVDDAAASGGKAVRIGTLAAGSCPVATKYMPDGPDDFGGCYPGPETTGVPKGTALTTYSGPNTITANNTVIDKKIVNGNLDIRAKNVTITNSQINGAIINNTGTQGQYSFTVTDSTIHTNDINLRGLMSQDYVATRVKVSGGQSMAWCSYCTIQDSYLHGPLEDPAGAAANKAAHNSTVRMAAHATIKHNTLWCEVKEYSQPDGKDTSGCSANQTGYSHDGSPPFNSILEKNLYMPTSGGTCAYGGSTTGALSSVHDIVFRDNVFKRGTRANDKGKYACGYYFAVANFDASRPGNEWTNNKFDDGVILNSNNSEQGNNPPSQPPACPVQTQNIGMATATLNIPEAGKYRIWSRIMTGSAASDNSYSLQIGANNCHVVGDNSEIPANTWTWVGYENGLTSMKIDRTLTQGNHTIKMIGRESGVKIDKVMAVSDPDCIPTGDGSNCAVGPVVCDRNATTATFASQISAATAGQTICLASGNYGQWRGTNKAITVKAAEGASPQMTIELRSDQGFVASNFTLDGMTGMNGLIYAGVNNVTIKNSAFTGSLTIDGPVNSNILLDNNTHININYASAGGNRVYCGDTPAAIALPYNAATTSGVTVQNSLFKGGHKDGIQAGIGLNILNNEFTDIYEHGAVCDEPRFNNDTPHTDPIQLLGAKGSVVRGNYLHDVADGIVAYDGIEDATIEHNIVDIVNGRWGIELYADKNSVVRHNTLVYRTTCAFNQPCGQLHLDHKSQHPAGFGTQIYDNIITVVNMNSGSTASRNEKNLVRNGNGGSSSNITGSPTYVGGATPSTIAGFALAANSLGKNAATDGKDIGADVTKVGRNASASSDTCLASNDCFPKPPNSGPGSTGVPAGTALRSCGSSATISTANTVIDGCIYTGSLRVAANNVTIRNSRIHGAIINQGGATFTVEDSDLGPDSGCASEVALVAHGNFTARRNYLHNNGDGFRAASNNVTIEDNFVSLCDLPGDHSDGIQGYGSGLNNVIRHNTIDQRGSVYGPNAPIFYADYSKSATITDNLVIAVRTDAYALRIHDDQTPDVGPWIITGNRLVGTVLTTNTECNAATTIWSNNRHVTIDDNYKILTTGDVRNCNGSTSSGGGSSDTTPPTVSVTAPANNATVSDNVTITANASDNVGLAGVQFQFDGENIGSLDSTPPYQISWNVSQYSNGPHSITAVARDAAGNTANATINVTVAGGLEPSAALRAAYNFNEGTGTSAADLSGNNNALTLVNGATWAGASGGKYQNGLSLDGSNDHATRTDNSTLDLGANGTISAWVKLDTLNRWHGVIAKGNANNPATHNYAIEVSDTNRVLCTIGNGSTDLTITSSIAVDTTKFYHLACAWNGSMFKLYIDGVERGSVTQSIMPTSNAAPLYVGMFGGNVDYLDGVVDDVRIYSTALSASDIAADMDTALSTGGCTQGSGPKTSCAGGGGTTPDTTPPQTTISAVTTNGSITLPAAPAPTATTTAHFSFISSESGSTFQCKIDRPNQPGNFTACTSPVSYSGLSVVGTYTFSVRATDAASNQEENPVTFSWLRDNELPTISLTAPTVNALLSGTVTLKATASDNLAMNRVQFVRCNSSGSGCVDIGSPVLVAQATGNPATIYTYDYSTAGLNGDYRFGAIAYDQAGNQAAATQVPVTLDNTAPIVSITTAPASLTASTSASFSFSSTEPAGASFRCSLDNANAASFTTCASPRSYSSLSSTEHTFYVQALDAAGNVSAVMSHRWVIDTEQPAASFTAPSNGAIVSGAAVPVAVDASDNVGVAGVTFRLNGANLAAEDKDAPYNLTWNTTQGNLSGQQALSAVIRDTAGNSRTVSITVTVDNTSPDTTAPSKPNKPRQGTNAPTATTIELAWDGVVDDRPGTVRYHVYRGSAKLTASPVTATSYTDQGLTPDTSYSYRVTAVDSSGNESSKSDGLSLRTIKAPEPETEPQPDPTPEPDTAQPVSNDRKAGDLDGNGRVQLRDLSMLLARYGQTGQGNLADLDGNGRVELRDLSMLLARWEG